MQIQLSYQGRAVTARKNHTMVIKIRAGDSPPSPPPPPPQKEGLCQLFLKDKRRYCRQPAIPGGPYCGNHRKSVQLLESAASSLCPLGCGEALLPHQVDRHISELCVKLRMAARVQGHPCYSKGCNEGGGEEMDTEAILQLGAEEEARLRRAEAAEGGTEGEGDSLASKSGPARARHLYARSLGPDGLQALIARLEAAHRSLATELGATHRAATPAADAPAPLLDPFPRSVLLDQDMMEIRDRCLSMAQGNRRPIPLKHHVQQVSIVGNLRRAGLLHGPPSAASPTPGAAAAAPDAQRRDAAPQPSTSGQAAAINPAVVEYGAGKGYLSLLIAETHDVGHIVLNDVRSFRLKADRLLRDRSFQRITLDIADFDVGQVQELRAAPQGFLAVGKHLCGAATDLTVRSVLLEEKKGEGLKPVGLGIATCCHHRCCWRHFVARDKFLSLGLSPQDFEMAAFLASWAISGHGPGDGADEEGEARPEEADAGADRVGGAGAAEDPAEPAAPASRAALPGVDGSSTAEMLPGEPSVGFDPTKAVPRHARQRVGRVCKELIDMCRVHFLRGQGWETSAVRYAEVEDTGECTLILSSRP